MGDDVAGGVLQDGGVSVVVPYRQVASPVQGVSAVGAVSGSYGGFGFAGQGPAVWETVAVDRRCVAQGETVQAGGLVGKVA